ESIPQLTKIARKPVGVGTEYKNIAECTFGIMLSLEVQEGKNLMQNLPFTERYAKHTALVLRLAQNYLNKGHIVYGDSAFSSVSTATALLEHNTFYTGLVKQCFKGFPKQYL
ncbi:hypothetical protein GUITHDRAFT_49051, partial [Guillardia theta CCMP2712]